jgi:Tol biopolymer transport system component
MDGDREPRLFLESRFDLWHADLSADARWLAYVSTESGNPEVYVQPYPGPGEKVRISTAGGFDPIWTRNGKELLFRSGTLETHQVLSVAIRGLSPFRADTPRVLFETKPGEYDSTVPERSWDVSADGQRFLLVKVDAAADKPVTTMNVVLNWSEELKQRVR